MPTISGTVKDRSGNGLQKYVTVQKRSTLLYVWKGLSNPTTGAYSVTVPDSAEYVVRFSMRLRQRISIQMRRAQRSS
jgi:hypothetical protein